YPDQPDYLSYPDQPDYEAFRRTEIETLAALTQEDPYRALTFRLLMSHRRLREVQLMVLKEKFQLVPPALEAYGEAIQRVMENLQTLPREALTAAGAYWSIEVTGHHQMELLQTIASRVPQGLNPAVQDALAASQQLRLFGEGMTRAPEARLSTEGFGRRHSATIEEPLAPEEALSEEEGISPLSPAATPKVKILQPAVLPPRTPDQAFGRRLRPFERRIRGLRRPGSTHPRPRSRERGRD
ncbi:hypothetical protein MYX64_08230, partial [Nitrospinae bacterium AH_259_B05_G02_I21]|nr:hypothetical protein [Nitrospinae bacterium AH_259_B05_G02_I21]